MLRRRIGEILLLPTEQFGEYRSDIGDGSVVVIEQRVEAFLMRTNVAVDDDAAVDQHRRRDDESDRLDKPQPFAFAGSVFRDPETEQNNMRFDARKIITAEIDKSENPGVGGEPTMSHCRCSRFQTN